MWKKHFTQITFILVVGSVILKTSRHLFIAVPFWRDSFRLYSFGKRWKLREAVEDQKWDDNRAAPLALEHHSRTSVYWGVRGRESIRRGELQPAVVECNFEIHSLQLKLP